MTLIESSEQRTALRTVTYNLDGSETFSEVANQPANRTSHRLLSHKDGVIEIVDMTPAPEGASLQASETWALSNNGKTLKMVRKIQPPKDSPLRFADVIYTFQRMPPGQ